MVTGVLITLGFVNLFPSPLAALMQKRLPAHRVLMAGPLLQAGLALLIISVMIFTHTFAFGLLATLDASGRAVAATPAMLMIGAAIGPVLGGTLVKTAGYGSLGIAAVVVAACAVLAFSRVGPVKSAGAALA